MTTGTIHKTNSYGDLKIVEYTNAESVLVMFIGYDVLITAESNNIRKGKVKNVMAVSVLGVGYVGSGIYSSKNTDAYCSWKHMLGRCYCPKELLRTPSYTDCTVSDEWHNFQNFAEWFYSFNTTKGLYLDKDLRVQGNKVYGPKTCLFVSRKVNNAITERKSDKGKYPSGVSLNKSSGKFEVYCSVNGGKKISLGCYSTPEEAGKVRNAFKQEYVNELANEQTCSITRKSLLAWEIN